MSTCRNTPQGGPMGQWLRRRELKDGTFLVWYDGDNEHLNHWHVAPDGTVLSVKEGGNHKYKRDHVRRKINEVTGFSWPEGWEPV